MFKVDILSDARQSEEHANAFVEQTKQLLLEEGTRETGLLAAAGLNKQHVVATQLKDEKAMRAELGMKTGAAAVLTRKEIEALCIKYRLRFLRSHYYSGSIDALTGRKILKFMEDIGEPSAEHAARENLFVMAPVGAFNLEIGRPIPDPVLFYRHKSGLFCVVHKWGNDFTVFREVWGWLTANAVRWRFFMLFALLGLAFAGKKLLCMSGFHVGEYWFMGLTIVFAIIRGIQAFADTDASHEAGLTFSEECWDEERIAEKPLFWQ